MKQWVVKRSQMVDSYGSSFGAGAMEEDVVRLTDATDEIERRVKEARAEERERIKREYGKLRRDHQPADAFSIAIRDPEDIGAEIKPVEHVVESEFQGNAYWAMRKFNALVDVVNALIARGK